MTDFLLYLIGKKYGRMLVEHKRSYRRIDFVRLKKNLRDGAFLLFSLEDIF